MTVSCVLRLEEPTDMEAIYRLTEAAFKTMPYSAGDEQDLINALRDDDALAVSVVAELGGEIVGHVAFSRVTIDSVDCGWFDLGPVSVAPVRQNQGIGGALIRDGLARIKKFGAKGCVLLGYPAYYARFGFAHSPRLTFQNQVNPNFQYIAFEGLVPSGNVGYHPAFGA